VKGGFDTPFTIIQAFPFYEIPVSQNIIIASLKLGSAFVLTVVQKSDSPDQLIYLHPYSDKEDHVSNPNDTGDSDIADDFDYIRIGTKQI
jgi:hypothetical protein